MKYIVINHKNSHFKVAISKGQSCIVMPKRFLYATHLPHTFINRGAAFVPCNSDAVIADMPVSDNIAWLTARD